MPVSLLVRLLRSGGQTRGDARQARSPMRMHTGEEHAPPVGSHRPRSTIGGAAMGFTDRHTIDWSAPYSFSIQARSNMVGYRLSGTSPRAATLPSTAPTRAAATTTPTTASKPADVKLPTNAPIPPPKHKAKRRCRVNPRGRYVRFRALNVCFGVITGNFIMWRNFLIAICTTREQTCSRVVQIACMACAPTSAGTVRRLRTPWSCTC